VHAFRKPFHHKPKGEEDRHISFQNQIGKGRVRSRVHRKIPSRSHLIIDLEDEVAYTSFPNGLKSSWFKFSLAEQKETVLAKALNKAVDFIRAVEICTEGSDGARRNKAKEKRWAHAD